MPQHRFTSEEAREAGKKGKRGEAELSSLAKAVYLKVLAASVPEVESAMAEVRKDSAYQYMNLVARMSEKLLPDKIDLTSGGNELTLLSNDELVARLNKLIARFDQD